MIKTIKALAIGLAVVGAGVVVAPASASASLSDCKQGQFCVWPYDNFDGRAVAWYGSDTNWGNEGINDDAESLFNHAVSSTTVPDNVNVYLHANHVGLDICVLPGETYDAGMNDDDYSSHKWVHSC